MKTSIRLILLYAVAAFPLIAQNHQSVNINGTNVLVPSAPYMGAQIYGASYGQCLMIDVNLTVVGGPCGASQNVQYASKLCSSANVAPGQTGSGTRDCAAALNALLQPGNVDLEVDIGVALSTSLLLSSNTRVHCLNNQTTGFIMQPGANAEVLLNRHPQAGNVPSGTVVPGTSTPTGNVLVSNQADVDIEVSNCMLNANADNAVTGSDNVPGIGVTQHTVNPATGWAVNGVRFVGVDGLRFTDNTTYNSGMYSTNFANLSHFFIQRNRITQPMPLVPYRSTDGLHFDGPVTEGIISDNFINSGDDCIPLNADDGQEARFSSNAFWGYVQYAGETVGGPITKLLIADNTCENSLAGLRGLSQTERIDDITIRDMRGTVSGTPFNFSRFLGFGDPGNYGTIKVDGWYVNQNSTAFLYGASVVPAQFNIDGSWDALILDHVEQTNPTQTWPLLQVYGSTGTTIKQLVIRNPIITNYSGLVPTPIFQIDAPVTNLSMVGGSFIDQGSGYIFGGTGTPTHMTVSNFTGASGRLLAPGFWPASSSGDGISATVTKYLATTFNEGSSGASVAGTAPATFTGTGYWTMVTGSSPTFASGGGVTEGAVNLMSINTGQVNENIKISYSNLAPSGVGSGGATIGLRVTNASNYIAVNVYGTGYGVYDITGGVATQIANIATGALVAGEVLLINLSGNTLTFNDGLHSVFTATLPAGSANTSATNFAIGSNSPTYPSVVSSLLITN